MGDAGLWLVVGGFVLAVGVLALVLRATGAKRHDAERVAPARSGGELPADTVETREAAYRRAVYAAVADQRIGPEEQARLELLARGLSAESVARANLGAFNEAFYALVGDGKLTEEEEDKLTTLRRGLGIPDSAIARKLATADQLRRARQVERAEKLDPVAVDLKLKKGETCFYVTDAAELRHYTRDDDFLPVNAGTLHVTNQRLLLVSEGSTTVKLAAVLRLSLEPKREGGEALAVTVEGRKTPVYLDAPEPYVLRAHIARVLAAHAAAEV